ncbi:MAG: HYR domain-containing protein [Blastocatellales bacterium]
MRSSRSIKSAHHSKLASFLLNPALRITVFFAALTVVSLSIFILQSSASANGGSAFQSAASKLRQVFRSALNLTPAVAVQGGIGSRTVISTISGGGFSTNAPVRQAPMVLPTGVALDPLGRGFYVADENNGTGFLRFVNTTNAPVTLAGVTILPGHINLIAGGGVNTDATALRDIDLTLISGLCVDPSGNVVYLVTPLVNALRAINVGSEDFSVLRQTIQPGTIKTIYNLSRPDVRSLVINSAREFFFIGLAQSSGARVVYKLDPAGNGGSGLETIYAGGGNPPFGNGDGQQATQGKLTTPMGLAIDTNGNLLIAEGGDTRGNPGAVRKVDSSGIISSLITNLEFPTGITLGPSNSVYVALGNAQQVLRVSSTGAKTLVAGTNQIAACDQNTNPSCGDGGLATEASLNIPGSTQLRNLTMAADSNGFYLPDYTFRRVRYVNTSGGVVNIAGTAINGGQINTVAGSGQQSPYDNIPATITELNSPLGVAADANGNLYVADTNAEPVGSIRFINRGQTPVTLFAGLPWEMTVQPGHIATLNNKAGDPPTDDRITTAVFASPQGLAVTSNGIYIVDSQYGALVRPAGSLTGRRSGHIRFLNTSNSDVTIFPNGGAAKVVVPPGQIKDIVGRNDQPTPGSPTADDGPANTSIIFPTDVALDSAGNIYIADQGNNRIRKVNASTGFVTSLMTPGSEGLTPLVTGGACGIAVTSTGRVYIADTKNDRVLRQDAPNGTSFTTIGNSTIGINRPRDLTVDASGNTFVANAGSEQILRIVAPNNALGTVSVVAGNGQSGFSGDGGPANRARLNLLNPGTAITDVQVTNNIITLPNGDTIFADAENNRLRMLVQQPNQAPVLAAIPNTTVDEGQTATINITATDGNGDPLTFTAQGTPGFATFSDDGNSTAKLVVSPGFTDSGTYNVSVAVNDGDATDSKSFTLTIREVNRPPVVNVTPISPSYEATSPLGRAVNLLATASDPDGDSLTYKWFDGNTQIASILTPQVTLAVGNHSIFLTVTDSRGGSTSSSAQQVIVQDTTPPTISGVPADITIQAAADEGALVTYTMPTALDIVDGVVQVATSKASGTIFPVGTTTVNFTATDSRGNQATASFKVTVTPKPGGGGGGGGGGGTGCGTATSYTISTFAGSGGYGFSGDNGDATNAAFRSINQLTANSDGVTIVDSQSRVVRRVDSEGKIRTIAGNSANGNSGDGGLAIYATFGSTGGVVKDADGNIYVSDTNFHRIRRIGADGKIFHFAGSATGVSGSSGDNGQASAARFNRPTALAVDKQNNLYVVDTGNHRVRVINLSTGIIINFAGTGGAGFNGDGVVATSSSLNNPTGIAIDGQDNVYIADRNNQRIRKVNASSKIVTTVAGSGMQGFGGDGGAAMDAMLNYPNDVAVDSAGNVYFTDQSNHRVRRVKTDGKIETIAGNGSGGYSGDGGAALQAQLNLPTGIAVDASCNVYIGDNGSLRVRKLTAVGGGGQTNRNPVITSNIGNQTLTRGQTVDIPLTATDEDNDSVTFTLVNAPGFASIVNANPAARTATLRLAPTAAATFTNVQIKADDGKGGTATSAAFNITVNEPQPGNQPPTANAGQLPGMIEATSANGAQVNLNGSGSDPDGDSISFAWTDNGNTIATSPTAAVTLAIGNHSIVLTVTDSKGAKTSATAQNVVVKDSTPPVIAGIPAAVTVAATSPSGAIVNFALPTATDIVDGAVTVAADKAPNTLFPVGTTTVKFTATDSRGNAAMASFNVTVTPFVSGGTPASYNIATAVGNGGYGFSGDGGDATNAALRQISALTRYSEGLMVVDSQSRVVRRVDNQGKIRTIAGNTGNGNGGDGGLAIYANFGSPGGAVADSDGNIYVSDSIYHRIRRITSDGKINHFAGSPTGLSGSIGDNGPAASARFNRPTALAIDAKNNLYVVDSGNHRIRVIDLATGIVTNFAGNGGAGYGGDGVTATTTSLNNPTGVAIDALGNVFIADRSNHRIRKVDAATQNISTVAGNGSAGFSGDNNQATAAQLNNPSDVGVDAIGNIYIVDQNNHRIRRVRAGIMETIAGTGEIGFSGDGGLATQAQITLPTAIEVETDNTIFVGDNGNLRVRKLTPAGPPPPPPNSNPVITSSIGNQTLTRGQTVDLPLAATDVNGDSVTFSLVNAPVFATIINANPAARTATLRLTANVAGTFNNVQVKADDGKGGTATSPVFSITVNEPVNTCIATVPTDQWKGEYFANRNLSGNPSLVRNEGNGQLNLGFELNSPSEACGIPADNFSARFTRQVQLQGGVYRFSAFADDGVRLYINNELKIDQWMDQSETRFDVDVALTTGIHTLRMEFYENGGSAAARLFWSALNNYPVINAIQNQSVTRGQMRDVEITATDADNDPVKFELVNAPSFVTLVNIDQAARKATLRIAPPAGTGADQQFTLTVKANDGRGGQSVSNPFTVTVTSAPPPPPNRAPVAVANQLPSTVEAPDQTGATISLNASGSSDPDGDPLSYSWTDQGIVIATTAVASVKLPIGTHLIALTVNDGKGGVSTTTAQTVTITPPPPPSSNPVINSIVPSLGKRGTTVNTVITGSGFEQGSTVSLSGGDITITTTFVSPTQLNVKLAISASAIANSRTVTIRNPNGSFVSKAFGFAIIP